MACLAGPPDTRFQLIEQRPRLVVPASIHQRGHRTKMSPKVATIKLHCPFVGIRSLPMALKLVGSSSQIDENASTALKIRVL